MTIKYSKSSYGDSFDHEGVGMGQEAICNRNWKKCTIIKTH